MLIFMYKNLKVLSHLMNYFVLRYKITYYKADFQIKFNIVKIF